jgi:hypothetical protein
MFIFFTQCNFLKDNDNDNINQSVLGMESDYFSNSLIPGKDNETKLRKIIESLVRESIFNHIH